MMYGRKFKKNIMFDFKYKDKWYYLDGDAEKLVLELLAENYKLRKDMKDNTKRKFEHFLTKDYLRKQRELRNKIKQLIEESGLDAEINTTNGKDMYFNFAPIKPSYNMVVGDELCGGEHKGVLVNYEIYERGTNKGHVSFHHCDKNGTVTNLNMVTVSLEDFINMVDAFKESFEDNC
jgi:hypothetical protein